MLKIFSHKLTRTQRVVFVSIPTKGTVEDGKIKDGVVERLAQLHIQYPRTTFVCPMLEGYQILPKLPNITTTYKEWEQRCRSLIEICDEVWVLLYDGWSSPTRLPSAYNTSAGVADEIAHAQKWKKKVCFIEVPK